MQCVAVKFVPRLLNDEQEEKGEIRQDLFHREKNDKTFKKSLQVKGHGFTDMTSKQKPISSRLVQKKSPRPKNALQIRSNVKVVFDVFDCEV
jgi:hypothetical protein